MSSNIFEDDDPIFKKAEPREIKHPDIDKGTLVYVTKANLYKALRMYHIWQTHDSVPCFASLSKRSKWIYCNYLYEHDFDTLTKLYIVLTSEDLSKHRIIRALPSQDTKRFVHEYDGMLPTYHIDENCEMLNADYVNFAIPEEIQDIGDEAVDTYRKLFKTYFQDNLDTQRTADSEIIVNVKTPNIIAFTAKIIDTFKGKGVFQNTPNEAYLKKRLENTLSDKEIQRYIMETLAKRKDKKDVDTSIKGALDYSDNHVLAAFVLSIMRNIKAKNSGYYELTVADGNIEEVIEEILSDIEFFCNTFPEYQKYKDETYAYLYLAVQRRMGKRFKELEQNYLDNKITYTTDEHYVHLRTRLYKALEIYIYTLVGKVNITHDKVMLLGFKPCSHCCKEKSKSIW